MRPEDRENRRYASGSTNPFDMDEHTLMSFLPPRAHRVLDVGCGVGGVSRELRRFGLEVIGIDFSEVAVQRCCENGLDARLCDVDRDGLPFPDASFDVVWAGDVIEHVFDPLLLFAEVARILRPDGCLIGSVPNDFTLRRRWRIFTTGRSIQSSVYRKRGHCKHHTFFSWDLLLYMHQTAGLRIDRYAAVLGKPRRDNRRLTRNKFIGRLFARRFLFRAGRTALKSWN